MESTSPTFYPARPPMPPSTAPLEPEREPTRHDRAAFEALFQLHRESLRRFLQRRLGSYEDAEDAVSVTFSKAWRARDRFRGEASGKTWLYRIATRVVLDMLRARRCRPNEQHLEPGLNELDLAPTERSADPAVSLLESERLDETRRAVHQAIERLPADQRKLVCLHYFNGYKYEEISSILGIPYTQVRGRLHRIRQSLRRDLQDRQRWCVS